MTATQLVVEVDTGDVVRMLRRAEEGVGELPTRIAEVVAEEATAESRSRGITWRPRASPDLAAEAEQWWAHFLARGTRAHGPARRERMRFFVGGETVWARWVSGLPADSFHERGAARAQRRLDELAREVLG